MNVAAPLHLPSARTCSSWCRVDGAPYEEDQNRHMPRSSVMSVGGDLS